MQKESDGGERVRLRGGGRVALGDGLDGLDSVRDRATEMMRRQRGERAGSEVCRPCREAAV